MTNYRMDSYTLAEVLPGMQVGKDVLNDGGQVMVIAGTMLTKSVIEGLECWDVPSIIIRTEVSDMPVEIDTSVVIDTPIVLATPVVIDAPIAVSQQQFYNSYDSTTTTLKKAFGKMRYFKEVPLQQMKELAENEIFPLIESIGVIIFFGTNAALCGPTSEPPIQTC